MIVILEGILALVTSLLSYGVKFWEFFVGIPAFLGRFFPWAIDFVKAFPIVVAGDMLAALAEGLNALLALTCCSFIATFLDFSLVASHSDSIMFFLSSFRVGYGLGIIICAYSIRFVIRRLPFVG